MPEGQAIRPLYILQTNYAESISQQFRLSGPYIKQSQISINKYRDQHTL